jgi:pimeloyl-ACP methyl ester carboxylesterase
MFEGFALQRIDVGEAELRVRHGGSGPAVLLLHGHPRTHVTWHKVAPLLAERFTVVCPDLRGYGQSSKPPTAPDHSPYSKRAMAADCVALMRALGHQRFCVAGHDRGLYVAQRLAMDHPSLVSLCRAKTRTWALSWCFLCPSGCSPVLADQAVDDLPAFDPRGNVDRLAGLVQRRSLFARLVRAMFVVMPCVLCQDPPEVPLAVDQQVIEALAPQRSHVPLRKRIRPG